MSKRKTLYKKAYRLRYVGDGSFWPGAPARDLEPDEVERLGLAALLSTGLYRKLEVDNGRDKSITQDPIGTRDDSRD